MTAVELLPVVQNVFAETGLALAPDSLRVQQLDRYTQLAGTAMDGHLDVGIRLNAPGTDVKPTGIKRINLPAFMFNGLLEHQFGIIAINESAQEAANVGSTALVEIATSPVAINEAQQLMGRRPGIDAFAITRRDGGGKYTGGVWVTEGFANLQVLAADLTDWGNAYHDLKPEDHIHSWLVTPGNLCLRAAKYAQSLKDFYGDAVHNTDFPPLAVSTFAYAADTLQEFTKPLLQSLATKPAEGSLLETIQRVTNPDNSRQTDNLFRGLTPSYLAALFRNIGFLEQDVAFTDTSAVQEIVAEYVGHTATMLLRAETVRPLANMRASERRQAQLSAVVDAYRYAA